MGEALYAVPVVCIDPDGPPLLREDSFTVVRRQTIAALTNEAAAAVWDGRAAATAFYSQTRIRNSRGCWPPHRVITGDARTTLLEHDSSSQRDAELTARWIGRTRETDRSGTPVQSQPTMSSVIGATRAHG